MAATEKHISKSYDTDLKDVIDDFCAMGRLSTQQVTKATHSIIDNDIATAEEVIQNDRKVNKMEVDIDEQIVLIVAKRQPTASDLRLVMALSKGVVDLERIGDEASNVADMAKQLIKEGGIPNGYAEVQHLSNQVRLMLLESLDAFCTMDAEQALKVLQDDNMLNQEYQSASRSLMTYVMEDIRHFSKVTSLLSVFRALERIGKHARNISELVIYTTSGYDIRHTDVGTVEQAVKIAVSNEPEDIEEMEKKIIDSKTNAETQTIDNILNQNNEDTANNETSEDE